MGKKQFEATRQLRDIKNNILDTKEKNNEDKAKLKKDLRRLCNKKTPSPDSDNERKKRDTRKNE